jgi:NTP pyrophosphatase (non-canonical NTP hydrolase)
MSGDYSIGSKKWPGTSKLIEEMGELAQVLGKLIGNDGAPAHWDGTDLRERLIEEIADVVAALNFFRGENLTFAESVRAQDRTDAKLRQFQAWQKELEKKL